MKALPVLFTCLGILLFTQTNASALPFYFKATALFPVQIEELDPNPHAPPGSTIIKKVSLGTKELINLAQGLPIKTKIPSNIVLAVYYDDNNANPNHVKLLVFDKHTLSPVPGINPIVILIDPPTSNDATKDGSKGTSNGLSRATIQTNGNLTNGLQQTDVCGAATGSKTPGPHGPTTKLSVTSIVGPLQAYIDGAFIDGIIIKGMFSAGGKPLDPL